MIGDSPRRGRRGVCGRVRMMLVPMWQSAVNRGKILGGRTTRVALPRSTLVPVPTSNTTPHQVTVVVIQQSRNTQQIPDTDQIRPKIFHHRLLGTGVEVELPAEDGREDVELLMGDLLVGGRGGRAQGGRRIAQSPQAIRDTLEIQLDAVTSCCRKCSSTPPLHVRTTGHFQVQNGPKQNTNTKNKNERTFTSVSPCIITSVPKRKFWGRRRPRQGATCPTYEEM